jgi:hypothetical protein
MIQTILIVLVAVVVLIVIIAVLALRYLRADDSDTFDDIPDEPRPARRPAQQDRERRPAVPGRRPRQPEQVTEVWAADRPTRTPDARVPSGFRDRDTGGRPTGPQRAVSQPTARREAAVSRPVRASARPDGPDSVTSSWDSLSDVDYWAELAADKPEITPATGGTAGASRPGGEPVSDIRPGVGRPAARDDRTDSGQLPNRKRHHLSRASQPSQPSQPSRLVGAPSARAAESSQTEQIDVRGAQAATARFTSDPAASMPDGLSRHGQSRHATSQRPDAPAAQQRQRPSGAQRSAGPRQPQLAQAALPSYQSRPPAPAAPPYPNGHGHDPADNDPLTSPSFPAINAADSRSYRTRRSGGDSQPGTSGQHARPAADQGATSHQFIDYSSAPRRAASQPGGYPVQPIGTSGQPAAQAAGHQSPAAPAANPYGSYVSQPQPVYSEAASPQTGYSSAGYPETPAPTLATAAYSGYPAGQQPASVGWYAAPAIASGSPQAAAQPLGQPADGYLPAAGLGGNGLGGGSHVMNGSPARGYAGIDYSSIRYDDPVYPDAQGALPGYRSAGRHTTPQYDQHGYRTADPSSGQDGYGAYPGYGNGGR